MAAQKLGIVADDLTGAMDSSGYFASLGFSTVVILDPGFPSNATVAVMTTNSRAEAVDIARQRVKQAVRSLGGRIIYKKIDSTLRGNIGEELEAAIAEMAAEKAVVAPAFPAVGRTTVGGVLMVNGIPVAETQFANDPISPVRESHIPSLLKQTLSCRIGCASVEDVEAGPEWLYRKISDMPEGIIVCDVTEQSHLAGIARAAALAEGRWLLCGSGGLARELHLLLAGAPKEEKAPGKAQSTGIALAVVGTRNQVAANQLIRARDELGLPILNLEVEKLNKEEILSGKIGDILEEANRLLGQGKGLAISSTFSQYVPALKQSLAPMMAEITAAILAADKFAGLFLSGGDIAVEVCRRMQVSAIQVHGEVEPGVPAGELLGGQIKGMRVVTKAGGFGTEEAMVKSITYLEQGKVL